MSIKKFLLLSLTLFFVFGVTTIAFSEPVQIWGSTTCQKRFLEPGAKALKDATGVDIKVVGVGTGKGLKGLIDGKTPVSAASNPLDGAIAAAKRSAKKAGKEITIPDDLQFHEIYKDLIVPIVHKDNPVTKLTWDQLKDIHTGAITNWKDVGGNDLPIRVVTSHEGSATKAVFKKMVMKKQEYVANAVKVKSTRLEISEVSKYKGAIGAVSEGFHELNPGKTKIVKADTISRPLALITKGTPTSEVQKVIDFFTSDEGKKYIQ